MWTVRQIEAEWVIQRAVELKSGLDCTVWATMLKITEESSCQTLQGVCRFKIQIQVANWASAFIIFLALVVDQLWRFWKICKSLIDWPGRRPTLCNSTNSITMTCFPALALFLIQNEWRTRTSYIRITQLNNLSLNCHTAAYSALKGGCPSHGSDRLEQELGVGCLWKTIHNNIGSRLLARSSHVELFLAIDVVDAVIAHINECPFGARPRYHLLVGSISSIHNLPADGAVSWRTKFRGYFLSSCYTFVSMLILLLRN